MTTTPAFSQKRETCQKKGLAIYCQSCKTWVGWAKANQKSQSNVMEMDNDGQWTYYNSSIRRTHHPFPFAEEEESF